MPKAKKIKVKNIEESYDEIVTKDNNNIETPVEIQTPPELKKEMEEKVRKPKIKRTTSKKKNIYTIRQY